MPRVILAMLVALSMAVAPSTARAGWDQPSGGPLDVVPAANAASSSIANVAGVPYAAWAESSGGRFQIFVKRLEGTTWMRVGGSLNVNSTDTSTFPDIASVDGVPFVAWVEMHESHRELYVKRLIAGDWVLAGAGPLNDSATADASSPSIVAVSGVPYVAWVEEPVAGNALLLVDRFIAGAWIRLAGNALNVNQNENAQAPRLADLDGTPYVAWSESNGRHDLIHVRRFDGAAFVPAGSDPLNLNVGQDAELPSIAAVDGVPYVAWDESNGVALQVHVKRLVGPDWTTVGGSLNVNSAQDAGSPTIASVSGAPTVAWQELNGAVFQIRFGRFNGTNWQALGGPLNVDPTQNATFVDPALIAVGGVRYVTWQEANGAMVDIRVKRLEPDILTESAAPSGGGVTLTAGVNDFGMPLPVGFEYGVGGFSGQTPLQLSSGTGFSAVTQAQGGLVPGTSYVYRAFGSDTFRETSLGAAESFTTPLVQGGISSGVSSRRVPGRISTLVLIPTTFSAARRGAPIAAGRAGTLVSYVDSEPATATFTVWRVVAGRRAAGRCKATSAHNRSHNQCTRYRRVGNFNHNDTVGPNHFRFTGRVGGRELAPGRYRLEAIAHNSAGSGPPAYRNFEVKPS